LDGLYGWLASNASLMHDPALLRKVHQYMDRVLQLLMSVLKRNGCSIIHASYTKVLFATGKVKVLPDIQVFWESLCNNVQSMRVLEPLALSDATCLTDLYYGVLWMDPANWAGVPIDLSTGEVVWKAQSVWKLADFLPPAVRPALILYASELLLAPQKELGREYAAAAGEAADAGHAMDVDCDARGSGDEGEEDEDEDPHAGAAAEKAEGEGGAVMAGGEVAKAGSEALEQLSVFIKETFFGDIRRRILKYLDDIQVQQQREIPKGLAETTRDTRDDDEGGSDSDEDGECVDPDDPVAQERKAERLRRHLEQKWSFPDVPGRRAAPDSVELEFMRALITIFTLEDTLTDEVHRLRERMCQKLRMSSFGSASSTFESPCFPLILRDVACPWCCVASHVDVTSHPSRGPGLWVCHNCERLYDKDAVQARLVDMLENVAQAWQSQEIHCKKCRRLRTAHLQTFCECFGRFEVRFKAADFRMVLQVLRSLVVPHDLPWLGEMVRHYDRIIR